MTPEGWPEGAWGTAWDRQGEYKVWLRPPFKRATPRQRKDRHDDPRWFLRLWTGELRKERERA